MYQSAILICHNITQKAAETYKYKQRPTSTSRDLQLQAETYKYLQRPTRTCRDLQVQAETYKYL